MNRILALCILTMPLLAWSDVKPFTLTVKTVTDNTQVFQHRGGDIEIFPARRASVVRSAQLPAVTVASVVRSTPLSSKSLGVVFNYAQQQYGTISGEISFMLKANSQVSSVHVTSSSAPKRITTTGVYAVYARTPQAFLDTVRQLQKNQSIAWVQPHIDYVAVVNPSAMQ